MKMGFIGGGNMAAALIGGLRKRPGAGGQIVVIERDAARRAWLRQELGVATPEAGDGALADCDLVVLAVKPGDMQAVCEALRALPGRPLLVSIAAGIPSAAIAGWAGNDAVVRAMPNTPALVGEGITGLFARAGVSAAQRDLARQTLEAVGAAVWFDHEGMLDAVTAISGSGPAYVFYFIEALQAAARSMGMDAGQSRQFAVQTFLGAARLASQSGEDVALLRERVTSKGGTTAAALAHLQQAGVAAQIGAAAQAALARSRELGQATAG